MKVNFFATLRQIVGQKTVEIDLPENTTVQEFVEMVVTEYPPMRRELLHRQSRIGGGFPRE